MENLKSCYKDVYDSYDPWGSNISAFFAVAHEMYFRGLDIPNEWQYSAGATNDPRDDQDYMFEACENASDTDLLTFGKMLSRMDEFCRRFELNY